MTQRAANFAIGRLLSVLDDAHRLQRIIRQNEADSKLLSQNIKIYHMIDTRVFGIFAEPKRYAGSVSPFPSLLLDDYGDKLHLSTAHNYVDIVGDSGNIIIESDAILFANAMLTGELIVRFAMAAGDDSVLISPEHVPEVYGYIASIEHRLSGEPARSRAEVTQRSELLKLLTGEANAIRQAKGSAVENGGRLRRLVVERLAALSQKPGLALSRLEKQFQQGRIANAAYALQFGPDLIAPDETMVSRWRTRIAHAKKSNRVRPNPHALDADAVTLAQLQILNSKQATEKYVLITDDRGLQGAYAAFLREPGCHDQFYAIRDPRQYMPVLNVGEETGPYTDLSVFTKVRDSIDRLVTSFSTNDPAPLGSADESNWPNIEKLAKSIMAQISMDFATAVQSQIRNLSNAWIEMLEYALVAKADLMVELADQEIEAFGAHLSQSLRSEIGATGLRLSSRFLDLTESSVLLRSEIQILNKPKPHGNFNRRMLVTDFNAFESVAFAGRSLIDNVEMLRSIDNSEIGDLQSQDRNERLLVLGCMCLDLGAWEAAEALLVTASPEKAKPLASETDFFRCVARRLATNRKSPISAYTEIDKALDRLAKEVDPLRRMRVASEKIALGLSRWAFRTHLGTSQSKSKELGQTLGDWIRLTEYGESRLVVEQKIPAWQGLLKQYALNTFCLAFWLAESNWLAELNVDAGKTLSRVATSLFGKMKMPEFAFISEGVHGGIYPNLGRYALAAAPDQAELADQIIAAIKEVYDRDRREGILFDLPFIDRIELAYIRRILADRHECPSSEHLAQIGA